MSSSQPDSVSYGKRKSARASAAIDGFRESGNERRTVVIVPVKLARSTIFAVLMVGDTQTTLAESLPKGETEFS